MEDDEPTRPSWQPLAEWRSDLARVLSQTQIATSCAWESLRERVPPGRARAVLIELLDESKRHALIALDSDDATSALQNAEVARDLALDALQRARNFEHANP